MSVKLRDRRDESEVLIIGFVVLFSSFLSFLLKKKKLHRAKKGNGLTDVYLIRSNKTSLLKICCVWVQCLCCTDWGGGGEGGK